MKNFIPIKSIINASHKAQEINLGRMEVLLSFFGQFHLANRGCCWVQSEKTMDLAFTHSPFMETMGRKERHAPSNGDSFQKNTLLQATENVDFSNQNSRQLIVQDPSKWPLYIFTGTQHREKFKKLNDVYNTLSSKEEEKMMRWMKMKSTTNSESR